MLFSDQKMEVVQKRKDGKRQEMKPIAYFEIARRIYEIKNADV